jgi:hypothetical protein
MEISKKDFDQTNKKVILLTGALWGTVCLTAGISGAIFAQNIPLKVFFVGVGMLGAAVICFSAKEAIEFVAGECDTIGQKILFH